MAKFADVAGGKRSRQNIAFPSLKNADGKAATLDVRVLDLDEEAAVIRDAKAFAVEHGSADPKQDDPLFEMGHMIHTLAVACLDDEAKDSEEPFFASAAEVRKAWQIGRDGIVYLFAQQKEWQRQVAPGVPPDGRPEQYIDLVMRMAETQDAGFFSRLRLDLQQSYTLFTASLLAGFLRARLLSGLDSDPAGTDSTPSEKTETSEAPSPSPPDGEPA